MTRFFLALSYGFLVFVACGPTSTLDKTLAWQRVKLDYSKILNEKEISDQELFLMNYAIIRQRDYHNYEVEGKSFREILALAKEFKARGFPVKEVLEEGPVTEGLKVSIENDGPGLLRIGEGSRLKKVFKFNASFTNVTNKDIAITGSTFLIKGPFKDHLLTAAYETNCQIQAGTERVIGFLVSARDLHSNVLFNNPKPEWDHVGMDNLIYELEVEIGGIQTDNKYARYFSNCNLDGTRFEPFETIKFREQLKGSDWKVVGADGNVNELHFGPSFIAPEENDEPVTIY